MALHGPRYRQPYLSLGVPHPILARNEPGKPGSGSGKRRNERGKNAHRWGAPNFVETPAITLTVLLTHLASYSER